MHEPQRPSTPFGRGAGAAAVLSKVIVVAAAIGSRLPTRVAVALAVVGGHLEWALRPRLRRRLATNLAHAVGAEPGHADVRRLVRRETVNEARRSADLLWAIGRPDEFAGTVEIVGAEHADRAGRSGRGVVLIGIHHGGWEVATSVPASAMPVPTHVITADDWLAWAIDDVRRRAGLHPIRVGSPLASLRVLRRGECLLLLGDHALDDATRTLAVRFCDGVAHLPAGPVVLARLAGSPIVTFEVLPIAPRRWRVNIDEPLEPPVDADDEPRVLQQLADRWTAAIRARPDQWAARFPIRWEVA